MINFILLNPTLCHELIFILYILPTGEAILLLEILNNSKYNKSFLMSINQ